MAGSLQVRRSGSDSVAVSPPTFKSTCDGTQKAAIVPPPKLFKAIGAAVAQAFKMLCIPTIASEPLCNLVAAPSLAIA